MRPAVLVVCCLLAALSAGEPGDGRTRLADCAIRYVNEDIITFGDLVERLRSQRRGAAPTSTAEELQLWQAQLDELTIDDLLVQFADSKGVVIDRDRINELMDNEVRRTGRGRNLVDMARYRRSFERREKMRAALSFFDLRSATVSPGELLAAYTARKDGFRRPARVHVLQIVLRPSDPAERQALNDDQSQVFRRAQEADPATAAVVAPLLAKLVALDPESPERAALLDQAIAQLAALPVDGAAPAALSRLVEDAAALVKRRAALRSAAEVEAQLADLRGQLEGKGSAAFQQACKRISQGPRADEGGDLGWIEPGFFAADLDAAVFGLAAGEISKPVWSQQACCLTLVSERTEAAQRSFAEVVGELESMLRQERQQAIRTQAGAILRQRALVRDLASLDELMRSG